MDDDGETSYLIEDGKEWIVNIIDPKSKTITLIRYKKNKTIEKKLISFEIDTRYSFYEFSHVFSNTSKFDLVDIDPNKFKVIKNDDKYFLTREGRNYQLGQYFIDNLFFEKLVLLEIYEIEKFLDYQLEKYPNRLNRLFDLKALFQDENRFYSPLYKRVLKSHQDRCLTWSKKKLDKGVKSQPPKVPDLKALFVDTKYFEEFIQKLIVKGIAEKLENGKYKLNLIDIEVAVMTSILRQRNKLKTNIKSLQVVRKSINEYFGRNVTSKTFQPSTIESAFEFHNKRFDFIR